MIKKRRDSMDMKLDQYISEFKQDCASRGFVRPTMSDEELKDCWMDNIPLDLAISMGMDMYCLSWEFDETKTHHMRS